MIPFSGAQPPGSRSPQSSLALLAAALAPGAAAQPAAVSIPDAALRGAIEHALGKQSGEAITSGDMSRLTILDASNSGISQLDGLQHAVNMRGLYLQGNRISDASSLANMARMQVLILHSNDISEIDLTAMTDLRFLDLGNNDLATVDLSGQRTRVGENARTSKLYALWLHNNRLTFVDISGLTALQDRPDGASHASYVSLRLDRNQLTSVTGLAELPRQAWSLRLENNRLTSVDLRGAEHLHYLYLNNNPISSTSDLAGFSALTNLRRLHLYETDISSIDLSRFSRLERAFLNDNNLTSVDATGLDSIQRLWLRGNRITRITGLQDIGDTVISLNLRTNRLSSIDLSGLTSLRQLYLSDNQLAAVDLSPVTQLGILWLDNGSTSVGSTPDPAYQNRITNLGQLPRFLTDLRLTGNPLAAPVSVASRTGLRKLYVSDGQISGLSQVAGLTGLTELGLTDMGLTSSDLSNLSRLRALEKLDLSDNSIISVSSLEPLVRMTELRLDDNTVSDVAPLSNMSNLTDLYVAGNLIRDFAPLRDLIVAGLRIPRRRRPAGRLAGQLLLGSERVRLGPRLEPEPARRKRGLGQHRVRSGPHLPRCGHRAMGGCHLARARARRRRPRAAGLQPVRGCASRPAMGGARRAPRGARHHHGLLPRSRPVLPPEPGDQGPDGEPARSGLQSAVHHALWVRRRRPAESARGQHRRHRRRGHHLGLPRRDRPVLPRRSGHPGPGGLVHNPGPRPRQR